MLVGFQIFNRKSVAPKELVAEFVKLPVANVSDYMSRMTAGGANLRPMHA